MKKRIESNSYLNRKNGDFNKFLIILIIGVLSQCAGILNLEKDSILDSLGMGKKTKNHLALLGLLPQSYPGGDSVTKEIGESGEELTLPGVKVVIPPGALDKTINITMNKVAISEETYPGMLPMASQIELSPEGLQFKKPVQLSIDILGHNLSSRLNKDFGGIFYISDPSQKKWEILETQRNEVDGKLVANLNHFSIYAPLFLNIDRIATGVETNPAIISLTALALRDFLRFHDTAIERNGLFSFNSN